MGLIPQCHVPLKCIPVYLFVETSYTEDDDWNVVFDECSSLASKWQQLSAYLGLNPSIIDRIKSNFQGDCLGCLSEALKEWIKMNYDTERFGKPSWKTLLKAIAKIDKQLFNRLATEHQGTVTTRYCQIIIFIIIAILLFDYSIY